MPIDDPTVPEGSVPIPFAPGYRICDGCTVWSCWSTNGTMTAPWHIRKPRGKHQRSGHIQYELQIGRKPAYFYAHQLVLLTFRGPCPPGMEGCHNDGDPENNFVCNLRWDTHLNNMADRDRHGTTIRGEDVNTAKLTPDDVQSAFQMSAQGCTQVEIAEALGVTQTNVSQILKRESWAHLDIGSDARAHTGYAFGERSGQSKLTTELVLEIFRLSHAGHSQSEISELVGVTRSNVCAVLLRKTWGHLEIPPELIGHKQSQAGERNGGAKIKAADVIRIFQMASEGMKSRAIAAKFGIARDTVTNILRRRSWASLPIPPEYLPR